MTAALAPNFADVVDAAVSRSSNPAARIMQLGCWTPFPDAWIEELARRSSVRGGIELLTARMTIGWRRTWWEVTHSDLARKLGRSRQAVSQAIQVLEAEGHIRVKRLEDGFALACVLPPAAASSASRGGATDDDRGAQHMLRPPATYVDTPSPAEPVVAGLPACPKNKDQKQERSIQQPTEVGSTSARSTEAVQEVVVGPQRGEGQKELGSNEEGARPSSERAEAESKEPEASRKEEALEPVVEPASLQVPPADSAPSAPESEPLLSLHPTSGVEEKKSEAEPPDESDDQVELVSHRGLPTRPAVAPEERLPREECEQAWAMRFGEMRFTFALMLYCWKSFTAVELVYLLNECRRAEYPVAYARVIIEAMHEGRSGPPVWQRGRRGDFDPQVGGHDPTTQENMEVDKTEAEREPRLPRWHWEALSSDDFWSALEELEEQDHRRIFGLEIPSWMNSFGRKVPEEERERVLRAGLANVLRRMECEVPVAFRRGEERG